MTRNSRHWAIAAAAFLAAAPVLAGCGAGSDAMTNRPYSPTEAMTTKVRGIDISQAFLLGPDSGSTLAAGGAAPLYLSLVNTNKAADTLVGLGVDPAVGTAKVTFPVELPTDKRVAVGRPAPTVMIQGLKKPLRGGESVEVRLQFANAGIIPLTVPVITRSREFAHLPQAPGTAQNGSAPTVAPTTPPTDGETGTAHAPAHTPAAEHTGHSAGSRAHMPGRTTRTPGRTGHTAGSTAHTPGRTGHTAPTEDGH